MNCAIKLLLLSTLVCLSQASANIDSLSKLKEAMRKPDDSGNSPRLAFFSTANLFAVQTLFLDTPYNFQILGNDVQVRNGVLNGDFLAGSVAYVTDEELDKFNVISSNVISAKAIFTLPDLTDEHPYGAASDVSRREFRNALNLAIIKTQIAGIEYKLAQKYQQTIADVRTCKLDQESANAFVLPNRDDAQGLLGKLIRGETLLVGWYENANNVTTDPTDLFNRELLDALMGQFAELSGPDGVKYGKLKYELVYAKSSTANLLRERVHMTGPYFLVDNIYRGSREPCQQSTDCIKSFEDQGGYESCQNNTCVSQPKPMSEVLKPSCFTYGTETLFITRKIGVAKGDSGSGSSGGTVAGFVILSLCLVACLAALGFVLYKERIGQPILTGLVGGQLEKMAARNKGFNEDS